MTPADPLIVVGYDGSAAARAAVDVAVERAAPDGHLVIVHAYRIPPDHIGGPYYQEMLDTALEGAKHLIDELAESCGGLRSVDWERAIMTGSAGEAIARVAEIRGAREIVIGTRGQGHLRAALGSVSLDVLHHATCPVLVIPDRMVRRRAKQARTAAAPS